jgi:hypothetical protein
MDDGSLLGLDGCHEVTMGKWKRESSRMILARPNTHKRREKEEQEREKENSRFLAWP